MLVSASQGHVKDSLSMLPRGMPWAAEMHVRGFFPGCKQSGWSRAQALTAAKAHQPGSRRRQGSLPRCSFWGQQLAQQWMGSMGKSIL